MPLHHIFFYCMVGIEVLLLIPFTIKYKLFNKEQRLIYIYIVSNAVLGVGTELFARTIRNNMAFVSGMMLVQFYILSFFFIHVLKGIKARKIVRNMIWVATLVLALDMIFWEGPLEFNSIFVSFRTFILIIYGVAYFLQLMKDESLIEQSIFINTLPTFWFNAGLFVNLCCSFLLNLCFNFIQQGGPGEVLLSLYKITASLTYLAGIIEAILFYIALSKIKGNRT